MNFATSELRRSAGKFPAEPPGWADLVARYQPLTYAALGDSILPFWWRTIDSVQGGVFNCWNNAGTQLVSDDKFTWSQGRFAWLWSRLAELAGRGFLAGDSRRYLEQAAKTVAFLEKHAWLEDGRCAFLLTATGEVKELNPSAGKAPSIYADCFVVMGYAEFARVSGDWTILAAAWRWYGYIERRIAAGNFPTHPDPIPEGHQSYAIAMIHLNVTLVLQAAGVALGDARAGEMGARTEALAAHIFDQFILQGGRVAELVPADGRGAETVLGRHLNPGHALEGLWMLMTVAVSAERWDWVARAAEAIRFSFRRGWDETYGGLWHYVDTDGGPPRGAEGNSVYEKAVRATWDTKLWWVHSEALYASLLAYRLTGDEELRGWFERTWAYTLQVFPQADPAVGEWVQIRDRRGQPLDRVVALPVKDPYHIARNLVQVLELFSENSA